MKTTTPPEPLYAFRVTNLGYSIAIIPANRGRPDQALGQCPPPRHELVRLLSGSDPRRHGICRVQNLKQEPTDVRN